VFFSYFIVLLQCSLHLYHVNLFVMMMMMMTVFIYCRCRSERLVHTR